MRFLAAFSAAFMFLAACVQPAPVPPTPAPSKPVLKKLQPAEWAGTYEGELHMFFVGKPDSPTTVSVMLEIAPIDGDAKRLTWRMTYKDPQRGTSVKDYALVKPDSLAAGMYWVDENNGLFISSSYFDNVFYESYSFGEQNFQVRIEHKGDHIVQELTVQPQKPINPKTENSFSAFPTMMLQKAVLYKK